MARAITSVPPPGGKGTMKPMGRSPGQAAPCPRAAQGRPARPAAIRPKPRRPWFGMALPPGSREPSPAPRGRASRSVELDREPLHHGALVLGALRDELGVLPAVQVLLRHVELAAHRR